MEQTLMQRIEKDTKEMAEDDKPEDIMKARKDSLDGAKFSADTLYKDSTLKVMMSAFSGILGSIMLLSAIGNIADNIKKKKKNFWIYPKTVLEFIASGVLIGYALGYTLIGLIAGAVVGVVLLAIEIKMIGKKEKVLKNGDS
jgi:hypothetical protein